MTITSNSIGRIDSHQHFWQLDRGDYSWLTPKLDGLYRDFLPNDLVNELKRANIQKTVLIQATDSIAETEYLLNLAEKTDFVAGVVGWVDMQSPEAPNTIRRLAENRYFKGVRPMVQDITDPDWILKPELSPAFDALVAQNLSFDALILPEHLDNLLTLLKRHPKLLAVIDHAAKPKIAENQLEPWQDKITLLANETSAFCKLSGLVTEANSPPSFSEIQPYVNCLLQCFGSKRLMWGSDWPVLQLATSYQDWVTLTNELLKSVPEQEVNEILSGTAREFYKI
ncbi:MAG: L-fuconolactonase [Arenicella sp.]|jgi:L-fuconolactonase